MKKKARFFDLEIAALHDGKFLLNLPPIFFIFLTFSGSDFSGFSKFGFYQVWV